MIPIINVVAPLLGTQILVMRREAEASRVPEAS